MAITNNVDESFKLLPKPNSDDWLGLYAEKGQTLNGFNRTVDKAVPDGM